MRYDPDIHHRRSIRLKHYDYSRSGAYFVTLCTFDRGCYFDGFPHLRDIVDDQWHLIPERFSNVELDEYVIMPNHFHGIVVIHDNRRDTPRGYPGSCGHSAPTRVSLGHIIGAYKSLCVNAWLKVIKAEDINTRSKFWQDNYYEHVIRNEEEMDRIRQYIVNNPLQWELDRENPAQGKQQPQSENWMV
ncbi:MAG: transposase [Geobacteraceae bacterium]|nr:transposase [Geobacteraceae bacterium]